MRRPNRRPNYTKTEDIENYEITPDYLIYKDDADTVAVNGSTGVEDSRNTDSATVINAAIAALPTGGVIYIKGGLYWITATIDIGATHGIKIEGAGSHGANATTLTLANGANCNLIHVGSGRHPILENMSLEGNKGHQTGTSNGVDVDRGASVDLHAYDIYSNHFLSHGWNIDGMVCFLTACLAEYNDNHGFNLANSYAKLTSCYSCFNGAAGYAVSNAHNQLVNCLSTANFKGIEVFDAEDVIINGCLIYDQETVGIRIVKANNIIVNNNIISDAGTDTNNTYDAIFLEGLAGNRVDNCLIEGNMIYSDHENKHRYGINEVVTYCDYNLITNNHISDSQTAAIVKNGAGTRVEHNYGHLTENSGTATILNTGTDIVVAHGLAATPTVINVTGQHAEVLDIYVDTVGAANFTITTIGGAVSAERDIFWEAKVR